MISDVPRRQLERAWAGPGTAAQGSGFVISGSRRDRHQRPRRDQRRPGLRACSARAPCTFASPTTTRFRRRSWAPIRTPTWRCCTSNPSGLNAQAAGPRHRAPASWSDHPWPRMGTPLGEQNSLSVGVISALNRAIPSLNGSPGAARGSFAIARRDPDRRGHQPRQLGRPAGQRGRRGDRDQLADRPGLDRRRDRASASPCPSTRSSARWRSFELDGDGRLRLSRRLQRGRCSRSSPAHLGLPVKHGSLRRQRRTRAARGARPGCTGGNNTITFDVPAVSRRRRRGDARSTAGRWTTTTTSPMAITAANPGRDGHARGLERQHASVTVQVTLGTRPTRAARVSRDAPVRASGRRARAAPARPRAARARLARRAARTRVTARAAT